MEGKKKIKSTWWNSEVETTWISLIGWPHETFRLKYLLYQFKVCGPNAECRARIHRPLCFCPNGFQGNPHVACEETPSRAGLRFKRQLERDYYVYKDYDDDYKNYQWSRWFCKLAKINENYQTNWNTNCLSFDSQTLHWA